jgi:hypothetical protein
MQATFKRASRALKAVPMPDKRRTGSIASAAQRGWAAAKRRIWAFRFSTQDAGRAAIGAFITIGPARNIPLSVASHATIASDTNRIYRGSCP